MKKIVTSLVILAIGIASIQNSNATIRRVFYWGSPTSLDYSTIQAAHDAAIAGDTIYVYPNTQNNEITITKRIVLLGNGYNFSSPDSANNNLQTFVGQTSNVSAIHLNEGSDSSVISGLLMVGGVMIRSNKNIIKRCWFSSEYTNIHLEGTTTGNSIVENFFANNNTIYCNYYDNSQSTNNLLISNNIFRNGYSNAGVTQNGTGLTGQISNNIFGDSIYIKGWSNQPWNSCSINLTNATVLIQNNISYGLNLTQTNAIVRNNIGWGTEWPSGNFNKQNISQASLFTLLSTDSPDKRFTLKSGSPAKLAGSGGIDCGVFAGTYPYVLSGIPATPTIYNISGPANNQVTGGNLTITISTKSNN